MKLRFWEGLPCATKATRERFQQATDTDRLRIIYTLMGSLVWFRVSDYKAEDRRPQKGVIRRQNLLLRALLQYELVSPPTKIWRQEYFPFRVRTSLLLRLYCGAYPSHPITSTHINPAISCAASTLHRFLPSAFSLLPWKNLFIFSHNTLCLVVLYLSVVMSFGFSISDVVLICNHAQSVYRSMKNAGEDFKSIAADGSSCP
jgi:hypothetical protein